MWILSVLLAGAGVLAYLSPDTAAIVGQKMTAALPDEMKTTAAASWFDGHQSLALMYLSMVLFFVTRTFSRLVDR
jgi:hypothetical protein